MTSRKACFFTNDELINLYTNQLVSNLRNRTATLPCCGNMLAPLNKFQGKMLAQLNISTEDALFHFNLAHYHANEV